MSTLPISTTNMTGLRIIVRGSSLTKLSTAARLRIARFEQRGPLGDPLLGVRHRGSAGSAAPGTRVSVVTMRS